MSKRSQLFAGCHLATHSKSWSRGSRGIGLLVILLLVLETSQYPSGLCSEEVALHVGLEGEDPSFGYIVLRFDLPSDQRGNLIVNPGFPLDVFRFNKLTACGILVLPGLTFLFVHKASFLLLILRLFQQVATQRSSMFLVRLRTPFGSSIRVLLEPLVTFLRHNDRCTLGKVVRLCISCCSPFAVVTKTEWPGCSCIHVCFRRHGPMYIIGQDTGIWVEHCPSRVLTSCTALIAILTVFVIRIGAGSWSL